MACTRRWSLAWGSSVGAQPPAAAAEGAAGPGVELPDSPADVAEEPVVVPEQLGALGVVGRVEGEGADLDRPRELAAQVLRPRAQLESLAGLVDLPAGGDGDLESLEGRFGDQRARLPVGLLRRSEGGRGRGVAPPPRRVEQRHGQHEHQRETERGGGGRPARAAGPVAQEPVEGAVLGRGGGGHPVQGLCQPILDHRRVTSVSSIVGEPSSPRSLASPRWASDLTVPSGSPSSRATSASGRSSW